MTPDLDAIRKLVELCRELGVARMKHGDVEFALGPDPAEIAPKREKPVELREPLKHPAQTSANGSPRSESVMWGRDGR